MRGPINTPITLTIVREGVEKPFDVKLVREEIIIQSVRSRQEGDVGYIRISSFNEQTFDGLKAAIDKLEESIGPEKVKGWVIDLRNDPGGLLDQAIAVSDAFLDRGEIVSTRSRHAEETQRYNAHSGDLADGKPVIILVNGGSASASEIVAGALQDHRRATIIGTRSFGKGSVQTIIPLGANGALRLTTARYFTPSGRSIQAKGIDPDIEVIQELPPELADQMRGDRAARRGGPQGPSRRRGRAGRRRRARGRGVRIARLCPAGPEGRQAAQLRARPSPRPPGQHRLPAGPERRHPELAGGGCRGRSSSRRDDRSRRPSRRLLHITQPPRGGPMSKKPAVKIEDLPYRPCVGIALFNRDGLVWVGSRSDENAEGEGEGSWWQMPQGGLDKDEDPYKAALRELYEETSVESVSLIEEAKGWLTYDLPLELIPTSWNGRYRGQKQKWFALRFEGDESEIDVLNPGGGKHKPEFTAWRWEKLERLPGLIVPFKRKVYEDVVAAFRHIAV